MKHAFGVGEAAVEGGARGGQVTASSEAMMARTRLWRGKLAVWHRLRYEQFALEECHRTMPTVLEAAGTDRTGRAGTGSNQSPLSLFKAQIEIKLYVFPHIKCYRGLYSSLN